MVSIPGGTFKMGNNQGRDQEKPEHEVTVDSFMLGRNEVTNQEYYAFVTETKYQPIPKDWLNGKPAEGTDTAPVRFVNIDDVNAFIGWRSKKDGVTYRLPTEEEWEYAARNGSKGNLYPWGDKFDPKCAVLDDPTNLPKPVGTKTCPDDFGVRDLIGNVFEWTSTPASLYPGSKVSVLPITEPRQMIRGGSYYEKGTGAQAINSTYRIDTLSSKRSSELGFRLARSA